MSFCRWSSMDFGCDLYCYESDQGYMTHIACNRVVGDIPRAEHLLTKETLTEFCSALTEQHKFLDTAERKTIGLPYDGETFCDATLEEFLTTLNVLKDVGYVFPDYVIESVQEEINDNQ